MAELEKLEAGYDSSGLQSVSFKTLLNELKQKGREAFLKSYPNPFLVVVHAPLSQTKALEPKTVITNEKTLELATDASALKRVVVMQKSDRNAFQSWITVGRAKNNDIIVRAPKVSKLHCAFVKESATRYQLMDMGSANGTSVNGSKLQKNKPVVLEDGHEIKIWRYYFKFTLQETMIGMLGGDSMPLPPVVDLP